MFLRETKSPTSSMFTVSLTSKGIQGHIFTILRHIFHDVAFLKQRGFFLFNTYFGLQQVFTVERGLSLVARSQATLQLQSSVFSLQWFLLWSTGFREPGLSGCRDNSCGSQAWLLGMWDLPGPGIEPASPALAGGFFITEPPQKSQVDILNPLYRYLHVKIVNKCTLNQASSYCQSQKKNGSLALGVYSNFQSEASEFSCQ